MKKRIITLVTLVCLLVGMSTSVFAAGDYGQDPAYPTPTPPVVTKPTPKPVATADTKADAAKEAQETIKNAEVGTLPSGTEGKVITVTATAKLPGTLIAEAINSDKPVSFMNADKTVAVTFKDLTVSADQLRDLSVNMTVAKDAAAKETILGTFNETAKEKLAPVAENATFIQPEAQGEFGVTMELSIQAGEKPADAKYENPFLYYIADDGTIENQGFAPVVNGWNVISVNHASTYMISYDLIEDAVVNTESANYLANKANGVDVDSVLNPAAADTETVEPTAAPEADATPAPASNNNSTLLLVGGVVVLGIIIVAVVMSKRKKDTDPTNKPKA